MFECDPNDIDKLSATLKTALQIDFVFNYTNLQKTIYKKTPDKCISHYRVF